MRPCMMSLTRFQRQLKCWLETVARLLGRFWMLLNGLAPFDFHSFAARAI